MKKILIVLSVFLVFLSLSLMLASCTQNEPKGDHIPSNDGEEASLLYAGEVVPEINVKIYNEDIEVFYGEEHIVNVTYAYIPFVSLLECLGAEIDWENKNTATISLNDREYVLDLKKLTFKEKGIWEDMMVPFPGENVFYCESVEKDVILNDGTIICILIEMGEPCHIEIDQENKTVTIKER